MEPIYSQNLCIRTYQMDDRIHYVEAANESLASVGVWFDWSPEKISLSEVESYFERCRQNMQSKTEYNCGIFSKYNKQFLGYIGINHINRRHNFANMGYWIRLSQEGQGYATEAIAAMSRFGFDKLKLNRLELVVAKSNTASRRVAEKSGAQFEGYARNRVMIYGIPHDAAMYSLVPEQTDSP